jgi:hypothetical protein
MRRHAHDNNLYLSVLAPSSLFLLSFQVLDPAAHGPPGKRSFDHAEASAELFDSPFGISLCSTRGSVEKNSL